MIWPHRCTLGNTRVGGSSVPPRRKQLEAVVRTPALPFQRLGALSPGLALVPRRWAGSGTAFL